MKTLWRRYREAVNMPDHDSGPATLEALCNTIEAFYVEEPSKGRAVIDVDDATGKMRVVVDGVAIMTQSDDPSTYQSLRMFTMGFNRAIKAQAR